MINQFKMLPTTPTRGYFGIWIRFFAWSSVLTENSVYTWKWSQCFIFFCNKEKLHKSYFLCDGQGHNALFTHWTDVTLFSAIRTHRGHLGHAKHAEKLNTWIFLRQKKNEDLTWKCSTTKCWCWWEEKRCIEPSNSIGYWGRDNQPIYPLHGADKHTNWTRFFNMF